MEGSQKTSDYRSIFKWFVGGVIFGCFLFMGYQMATTTRMDERNVNDNKGTDNQFKLFQARDPSYKNISIYCVIVDKGKFLKPSALVGCNDFRIFKGKPSSIPLVGGQDSIDRAIQEISEAEKIYNWYIFISGDMMPVLHNIRNMVADYGSDFPLFFRSTNGKWGIEKPSYVFSHKTLTELSLMLSDESSDHNFLHTNNVETILQTPAFVELPQYDAEEKYLIVDAQKLWGDFTSFPRGVVFFKNLRFQTSTLLEYFVNNVKVMN